MTTIDKSKVFGYIYRIFNPRVRHVDDDGNVYEPCYIGKTEETIHKRFQGHKRDAKVVRGSLKGGDGKLHSEMWAKDCKGFEVEELAIAYSPEDLSKKEKFFIEKYDSIKKGWNKITASSTTVKRGENISIKVGGAIKQFESNAHLCRQLSISPSALTHWVKKKGLSLEDAIERSILGKQLEAEKRSRTFEVFKKTYASINEIARDPKVNKHKLKPITIRRRVKDGMSLEEALRTPLTREKSDLTLTLPNGDKRTYPSVKDAFDDLTLKGIAIPSYSTIVSYMGKGQSPEQAFGFEKRPWELKYKKTDLLVRESQYQYVGEKSPFSEPVVVDHEKKIYTTVKLFASTYGLDYSNVSKKIKSGWTVEEILKKSGHLK
jgi:hypothetical protein